MTERHYEVISPQITFYSNGWYEPDEQGCCWALVKAPNARTAKILALKTDEFKEWVNEARGDNINPFKGVKANLTLCEHGNCWGCDEGCEECHLEWEAQLQIESGEW